MTYGDMTEVIAVAILKSAGVDIVALNQKTRLETSLGDLNGEFDLMINIDGELSMWDIKSASKFAFETQVFFLQISKGRRFIWLRRSAMGLYPSRTCQVS
jgi:Holliday junction resolvase-like predicted endonuclease